ncbi:hypothetical protein [Litchfieldia alkalitelluris]|uniref:hypothetical protein n=1 Tax=Litchfieldia alkalitelluris TaxID=304268 RepID=UPI000996A73F|nr:hypothetical protein [Litchfieldia alkalitelluris]
MKKKSITLGVALLFVFIMLGYFFVPLSAKGVFPHTTQIERIYFSYLNGGKTNFYLIEFNDNIKNQQLFNIFDSSSYTRSFGSKNIRNDGKAFTMFVFYRDRDGELVDYELDINEKGFVVSNKKKYKMIADDQEVFQQLSKWLLEKGIEQPIGTVAE